MKSEPAQRHPLDQLGEEFVARYRRGERPSVYGLYLVSWEAGG